MRRAWLHRQLIGCDFRAFFTGFLRCIVADTVAQNDTERPMRLINLKNNLGRCGARCTKEIVNVFYLKYAKGNQFREEIELYI